MVVPSEISLTVHSGILLEVVEEVYSKIHLEGPSEIFLDNVSQIPLAVYLKILPGFHLHKFIQSAV